MQPEILLGLVALILFPSGDALSHEISEALHSSINLTTSFDPNLVQDITWIHNISEKETQIAKMGGLRDHLNSEYKLFCNGIVLGISDLKANNCGLYIVYVTSWNNTTEKEEFNVTLIEEVKNDQSADNKSILTIVLTVVVVAVVGGAVIAVLWWKCWKRPSKTSENTSYSDVDSSDGLDREDHCSVFFSGGGGNDPAYCRV